MDQELLYLRSRAEFHRRMANQATCGEARCAHDAFVRAYLKRIQDWLTRREWELARPAAPAPVPELSPIARTLQRSAA